MPRNVPFASQMVCHENYDNTWPESSDNSKGLWFTLIGFKLTVKRTLTISAPNMLRIKKSLWILLPPPPVTFHRLI